MCFSCYLQEEVWFLWWLRQYLFSILTQLVWNSDDCSVTRQWGLRTFDFRFILGGGYKSTYWHSSSVPLGSSSSFLFGSGPPAPAAGPTFGTSQPPAFGQSQGSGQPSAPSFGTLSTPLFSAGGQPAPPAFGSVTSSTQPSVFGQQVAQQPGFGSATPNAGECRPPSSLLVSKMLYSIWEDFCLLPVLKCKNYPR